MTKSHDSPESTDHHLQSQLKTKINMALHQTQLSEDGGELKKSQYSTTSEGHHSSEKDKEICIQDNI